MSSLFQVNDLCFSYAKRRVLKDVHLQLEAGIFYGLIGANGSGKSTLLELLSGGLAASSGHVLFQDKPIARYTKPELATKIALVPQHFSMDFEYSVRDVVLMGRHPHIPRFSAPSAKDFKEVDAAMETMDITHLSDRTVNALSGGELQRVVMARALAQNTQVLILDEATSNLDIHHTIAIMQVIRKRVSKKGQTVIAAIHDLNLAAAFCDNCLVLKNGEIVSSGDVNTVFTKEMLQDVFSVDTESISRTKDNRPQIQYKYQ